MKKDYIKLATAAAFVFYFGCIGKANASDIPDIKLDLLGNDFVVDSNVSKINNNNSVQYSKASKKAQKPMLAKAKSKNFTGAAAPVDPPTPTLDDVNAQSSAWLDAAHDTYTLSTTESEGALTVNINGTTYYYSPSETDKETLSNLVATGSVALKETTTADNAVFSLTTGADTTYYTYDSNMLKKSIYTITEGTEDNYNFTTTDGTTTKYWKMSVKPSNLNQNHTTFSDSAEGSTGNVVVNLPNEKTQTIYYTYTQPSDYTETSTRINNTLTADNVNKKVFKNITGNVTGGAIYNTADNSEININSDFNGNSIPSGANTRLGGAICNSGGKIGDITGDFIANYASSEHSGTSGGAIYNTDGTIGNITGSFIANYGYGKSNEYGGAIDNRGTIGNITGNFIANYASASDNTSSANGGAIYNSGTIGNITGDFIANYASSSSPYRGYGGAIYNRGTIGNITGDFIANYALSHAGAIYNYFGTIGDITGDFIANYASTNNSTTQGGAIDNSSSTIGNINGNFISNHVSGDYAYGGAIYNTDGTIGDINGNFIANYTSGYSANGGAIYSHVGTIGDITGDFIANHVSSNNYNALGGAIYNSSSTFGNIIGNFISNYTSSNNSNARGGAIYNYGGYIKNIRSNFIGNYALGNTSEGGAIDNYNGTIDNITGDFIGNYTNARSSTAYGGAINNGNAINNISGDFIANYASGSSSAYGGAIHNSGTIKNITGNFEENYSSSNGSNYAKGGAVSNNVNGIIEYITGNYTENYATGINAYGGSIYNEGFFATNIEEGTKIAINKYIYTNESTGEELVCYYKPDFTNLPTYLNQGKKLIVTNNEYTYNYTDSQWQSLKTRLDNGTHSYYSYSNLNDLITENDLWKPEGGGIINSNFTGNYAKATTGEAKGGAIYTTTDLSIIADNGTSNFTGNYTETNGEKTPNAIYVDSADATLTLNSINNGTITFDDQIDGVDGYTLALTGDNTSKIVLNNNVTSSNATLDTTTLHLGVTDNENNTSDVLKNVQISVNSGVVDVVDGEYTNYNVKKLVSSENAKYNIDIVLNKDEQKADTLTVGNGSSGTVKLSSVNVNSNAPDNEEYVVQVIKAPDNNNAPQLYVDEDSVLDSVKAVMNSGNIIAENFSVYTKDTTNDSLIIRGAKNVFTEWSNFNTDEDKQFTFVDSGNYSVNQDIELTGKNIEIIGNNNILDINNNKYFDNISDDQNVKISGVNVKNSNPIENEGSLTLTNSSVDSDITNDNEMTIEGKSKIVGTITNNDKLNIIDADITFDKEITSSSNGNIDIKDSKADLKDVIKNQNITVTNSTVNLDDVNKFNNNSLNMNSGDFNVGDLGLDTLAFNNLSLNGGNINIDSVKADLANEKMGNIKANSYGENPQGDINVKNIIVVSDANKKVTGLKFVDKELVNNVKTDVKEVTGPIYKYSVAYSNDGEFGEDGYFKFVKDDNNPSPKPEPKYNELNPSLFVAPVAAQLGGYAVMLNNYDDALRNMDMYMMMTKEQRQAYKLKNKYASSYSTALPYDSSKTIYDNPALNTKPWTTFEKVKLKHGPKVSNVTYGTFEILESPIYELNRGWDATYGVYAAYNGSHQSFAGNSIYQNGGALGLVGMAYKDNFFVGATANVGANIANASTAFGDEDFGMLMTGVAAKAGYNFEFKNGKYVIQPSYMMSYSFINTEDYKNAAGVNIQTEALHAITMEPGVKFVANLKNGWQPYAGVSVVMNALDKTDVKANDVSLPELSIKPYVKYGVGVRKTYGDKAAGYLQTFITNGGRTGVGIQAGFRWTLGK